MKMVDKSSKLVDKFAVISGTGSASGAGSSGPLNMPGGGGSSGGGGGGGVTNSGGSSATAGLGGGGMTGANGQKPVPMKLFAAWEVDRTPPNCIPR